MTSLVHCSLCLFVLVSLCPSPPLCRACITRTWLIILLTLLMGALEPFHATVSPRSNAQRRLDARRSSAHRSSRPSRPSSRHDRRSSRKYAVNGRRSGWTAGWCCSNDDLGRSSWSRQTYADGQDRRQRRGAFACHLSASINLEFLAQKAIGKVRCSLAGL